MKINLFLSVLFLLAIAFTGYVPQQNDFLEIFLGYSFSFLLYLLLIKRANSFFNIRLFIGLALLSRLLLLGMIPNLSDDFYRYLWDGYVFHADLNPYLYLPKDLIGTTVIEKYGEIYQSLNSKNYYSVYPPINQYIFAGATYLFPKNMLFSLIIIRVILISFESITLYISYRLLKHFKKPSQNILWYALNPMIILELSGNLHFEAGMICFLSLALYFFIVKKNLYWSALAFSCAISIKLLPLLFMPFFIRRVKPKNYFAFFGVIAVSVLLIAYPIVDIQVIKNIGTSLDLYFRKFEFNASIYYLLRWLAYQFSGYNRIALIGPLLGIIVFMGIMMRAFTEKKLEDFSLIREMLLSLFFFLLCTTTLMPWYVSGLVFLSIFSTYKFAFLWSFTVTWSYINYSYINYQENYLLLFLSYSLVLSLFWYKRKIII